MEPHIDSSFVGILIHTSLFVKNYLRGEERAEKLKIGKEREKGVVFKIIFF